MFVNDRTKDFTIEVIESDGSKKQAIKDGLVKVKLPRQMDTGTKKAIESVGDSAKAGLLFVAGSSLAFSLIFAGLLQFLWGLVNTL